MTAYWLAQENTYRGQEPTTRLGVVRECFFPKLPDLRGTGPCGKKCRVRFATFNVNSIRARLGATTDWLDRREPDVVALQETKVIDADFPSEEFVRRGYGVAMAGQKTYNGVALLSRLPMRDIRIGLDGDGADAERRYISATIGNVRCVSVYVPNGKEVTHPAFKAKLVWLDRLRQTLQTEVESHQKPLIVGGDLNIAASELDVWSAEALAGQLHFHPDERQALTNVLGSDFRDAFRHLNADARQFSWWDFRGPSLRLNRVLRIDYVFLSSSLVPSLSQSGIDADCRTADCPSDHVPVVVDVAC